MSVRRPVIPLRFGTSFRKAFSDAAVFSRFAGDVLGHTVAVDDVRAELQERGRLRPAEAIAGLGADDRVRNLRVELWLLREVGHAERAARAHATAFADRSDAASARVATIVIVVPLAANPSRGEPAATYRDLTSRAPYAEQATDHGRLVLLCPWADIEHTPPGLHTWFTLFAATERGTVVAGDADDATTLRVLHAIDRRHASDHELEAALDEALHAEALAKQYAKGYQQGLRVGLAQNMVEAMEARGHRVDEDARAWIAQATDNELRDVAAALRTRTTGAA